MLRNRLANFFAPKAPEVVDGVTMYDTRTLMVEVPGAHLYVEMSQDVDRQDQLSLKMDGTALELVGTGDANAVHWEVRDAAAIRGLARALGRLADEADRRGMLEPLRVSRAGRGA